MREVIAVVIAFATALLQVSTVVPENYTLANLDKRGHVSAPQIAFAWSLLLRRSLANVDKGAQNIDVVCMDKCYAWFSKATRVSRDCHGDPR